MDSLVLNIKNTANKNAADKVSRIEYAISASRLQLLPLTDYMQITKKKMKKYMVDKFYHSIKDDIPIYIDNELIKWCGYEGELFRQKQLLMKLIKKYDIPLIEMSNDEYEGFRAEAYTQLSIRFFNSTSDQSNDQPENSEEDSDDEEESEFEKIYPKANRSNGKNRTKNILIMPDDFRMVVMRLPTQRGVQACRYYIELEKLVKEYTEYQLQFAHRREELLEIELKESRAERKKAEQERKKAEEDRAKLSKKLDTVRTELTGHIDELNDSVENLSEKLDLTANISVPPTKNESKLEKFVLVKLNDDDETTHEYYVIRAQRPAARQAFKKLREDFPNCIKKLIFEYQPNAMNLYNRIKEELRNRIEYSGNYISPITLSDKKFIREIKRIHNERFEA